MTSTALALAAVGIIVILGVIRPKRRDRYLQERGAPAMATVTRVQKLSSETRDGYDYRLHVIVEDGQRLWETTFVRFLRSWQLTFVVPDGVIIPVTYDPSRPQQVDLTDRTDAVERMHQVMAARGIQTEGVIMELTPTGQQVDGHPAHHLRVRVTAPTGDLVDLVHDGFVPVQVRQPGAVGRIVQVRYLPGTQHFTVAAALPVRFH